MNKAMVQIRWGSTDIKGPVHIYRERLMLKRLYRYVTTGMVLDAGCGTGSLALALVQKGYKVFGIEQSMDGLRWLVRKADLTRYKVTAVQANIESIPFCSDTFDAIVCGEVLEHVTNDLLPVSDFYRVLKPGGICVITVPANPRLWSFCDEYAGHQRRYTRKELIDLFLSNGFRVISVENWGYPLIRLYQRFIFRLYVQYKSKKDLSQKGETTSTRSLTVRKSWVDILAQTIASLFLLDNLFLSGTRGVGFLLVAQKEGGSTI